MKSVLLAATLAAVGIAAVSISVPAFAPQAFAQGAPQTLQRVNVTEVATGWRASKIIGATIYNEADEKIGKVDDLIVSRSDRIPYAIISVGGFLGMGNKLVAIPTNALQFSMDHTLLDGADKDSLKAMPAFTYTK